MPFARPAWSARCTRVRCASLCLFFCLASSVAAMMGAPTVVVAQESDEHLARQFFETGRAYFERADYERAAEAFAEAYRLSGRPMLLVNQARSVEALGDFSGAVALLEQALGELPEDDDQVASIQPRLVRLRAAAERQAAERAAAEAQSAQEPVQGQDVDQREDDRARVADDTTDEDTGPGGLFWAGIVTAGVGAAALVVSLATGIASNGVDSDLMAACPGGVCPPERAGDIDRGRALAAASTATLFIGGAAAIAGAVMIVLGSGGDDDDPSAMHAGPSLALVPGPGDVGAGAQLSF